MTSSNSSHSSIDQLAKELLAGKRRALAKALSIVEDGGPEATQLVRKLFPHSGTAHLIGVTGSPGVGKSTLVDALVTEMRHEGLRVAVIAIDPSSPFTGGAILGDRIRMQDHTLDQNVFIRSMANRGHAGGVALATYDAVRMLEAAGFDVVLIETVGVGQSELAIAETADSTVLVLMPGSGDDIQAIKSGIMEIGDIFVVNKGDLPGANKSASEIMASLELATVGTEWKPPVLVAIAESGQGMPEVWKALKEHRQSLQSTGQLTERRTHKCRTELSGLVADLARKNFDLALNDLPEAQNTLREVVAHNLDPHTAAENLVATLFSIKKGEGETMQLATFGAGCFWGVEEVFRQTPGVLDTAVGYCGGKTTNPSYKDVCTGSTDHAEVVQVEFDPAVVSFKKLLEVFFANHNPTTLNRQGPDVGTQYRSAIFYHTDEQKQEAEEAIKAASASQKWKSPIVTQVVQAPTFYKAEEYHQRYLEKNGMKVCH